MKGTLAARPGTEQTTVNCQNADCGTEDPDTPGDGETPGNGDPDVPGEDNEISGSGDPDVPDTDTPDSSIAGDSIPGEPDTPDTDVPGNGTPDVLVTGTPNTETEVPGEDTTTPYDGDVPTLSVMDTPEFSDVLRTLSTHQTFEYFAMLGDTQLSSDTTATDTVFVSGESLEGSSDAQFGEKVLPDTGGADIWKVTLGFLLLLDDFLVSRKPWKGVLARS